MDNSVIPHFRLKSQRLSGTDHKTPADIVSWMGAMQAQDYNMAKWAVGIRLPGCNEKLVEDAFNKGEILRTHVMRPTWHFISPEDIRWMLELTAPQIKSSTKSRDRNLEITEELYETTNRIIRRALEGNKHLTREALTAIIEKNGVAVDPYRVNHFMIRAELDGIVCSGSMYGKKHTYALLEERVPFVKSIHKEEALAKLAQTYFMSHGPATLQDFIWWSGLSATNARHALEMVRTDFVPEIIDSQTYWMTNSSSGISVMNESVYLLPAFDEYIISYKDRKAVLPLENHSRAISSNGIFKPTIVRNGHVIGIWKKANTNNKLIIPDFFEHPDKKTQNLIEEASSSFGIFLKS